MHKDLCVGTAIRSRIRENPRTVSLTANRVYYGVQPDHPNWRTTLFLLVGSMRNFAKRIGLHPLPNVAVDVIKTLQFIKIIQQI